MAKSKKMKKGMGVSDESMGGLPANCIVTDYPKQKMYNSPSGPQNWSLGGEDAEISANISKLNENRTGTRW